jgi:hypothetical protein
MEMKQCPTYQQPDTLDGKYKMAMKAVWHLYRRIQRDPNINWYCGSMTETLRLTCEAIAAEIEEDPEEVVRRAICVQLDDPQVERLRKQLEEIEDGEDGHVIYP